MADKKRAILISACGESTGMRVEAEMSVEEYTFAVVGQFPVLQVEVICQLIQDIRHILTVAVLSTLVGANTVNTFVTSSLHD